MESWLTLGLGQIIHKMSLEHLIVEKRKEALQKTTQIHTEKGK